MARPLMSRYSSARMAGAPSMGWAHAVEHPAQHVARNGQLEGVAQKTDFGVPQVDTGGRLEKLNYSRVPVDLQNFTAADRTVGELHFGQFIVGDALHPLDHHQGAGDFFNRLIFANHASSAPFSAMAVICSSISLVMMS